MKEFLYLQAVKNIWQSGDFDALARIADQLSEAVKSAAQDIAAAQQAGAAGPQPGPQAGPADNGEKDITDVDFEEVK